MYGVHRPCSILPACLCSETLIGTHGCDGHAAFQTAQLSMHACHHGPSHLWRVAAHVIIYETQPTTACLLKERVLVTSHCRAVLSETVKHSFTVYETQPTTACLLKERVLVTSHCRAVLSETVNVQPLHRYDNTRGCMLHGVPPSIVVRVCSALLTGCHTCVGQVLPSI